MPVIAMHSPRWPRVVAESLRGVTRPLATTAAPCYPGTAADLSQAWDRAVAPVGSPRTPPAFLLPAQRDPWHRTMSALGLYRGALLAEPVGSGKTWIALGVAAVEPAPVLVIGPAILRSQWQAAATRAGVTMHWWSHERLSRGQLPPVSSSLVIIDEAHRLREAATIRTRTLAPWLRGRRVLLLSATPIVNRLDDLVTLLRLILPEDALRFDGLPMLGRLVEAVLPPLALRRVVIRSAREAARQQTSSIPLLVTATEEARGERAVGLVQRLTRRHRSSWARLLASVLLDAAASSDAALRDALHRYRAMLRQAREAGTSDRDLLRRFAGPAFEQTVLWEMIGTGPVTTTLGLEELPVVEDVLATFVPSDQGWLERIRTEVADGVPSVCFTRHRATATLLRTTLGEGTAWITGDAAGIGPHRLPREAILAAFGPARSQWSFRQRVPHLLVATDVAAEGLDLQSAGRLVHVDLPWTAMRVAQREGRLLRLGQEHATVRIVMRTPGQALEEALARVVRVAGKRSLSQQWLDAMVPSSVEESQPPCRAVPWLVLPVADNVPAGELVLLSVAESGGDRRGAMAVWRGDAGSWQVLPAGPVFPALVGCCRSTVGEGDEIGAIVESATRWALRELLAPTSWGPPRLVARIHRLARAAAWRRDADALARLDRLLRWCTSPPTLGDRLHLEQLAMAGDAALLRHDAPPVPPMQPVMVGAVGVLLFRSAPQPLR